ncbi:hypothetical protein Ciccas_010095 [Cichlidogyrus casuarinus]|uniref:Uncharacterized protein n=1 Tax=Cichlidogyrus casuarinus TaxID=1844966 RepID=A0ABD2PXY3_9PLAT
MGSLEKFKKKLKLAFEADDEKKIKKVLFSDYEGEYIYYNCMGVHLMECYSSQVCDIIKRATNLGTVNKIIETLVLGSAKNYEGDKEKFKMVYEALASYGKTCHFENSSQFHYFVFASFQMLKSFQSNDPVWESKLKELMGTICSKRFLIDDETKLVNWFSKQSDSTKKEFLELNYDITMRFLQYHVELLVHHLPLGKLFSICDEMVVQKFIETIFEYSEVASRRSYYQLISRLITRVYIHKGSFAPEFSLAQHPESKFYLLRGEESSSDLYRYVRFSYLGNLHSAKDHWIEKIILGFKENLKPFGWRTEDEIANEHFRIIDQMDLYNEPFFGPLHNLKQNYESEPNPFDPDNGPCFRILD